MSRNLNLIIRYKKMKVVIAIDSFKGSMSSLQAGEKIKEGILKIYPEGQIEICPMADGGEGTVEAMEKTFKTVAFDAAKLAEEAGNSRTMNIVLFGALIRALGLEEIDWKAILRESIPQKFIEANLKAFELGMNEVNV